MKNNILKLLKLKAFQLMDYISIFLIIFFILTTLTVIYFYLHPTSETLKDDIPLYLVVSFGIVFIIILINFYLKSEIGITLRKTYLFSWDKIPGYQQNSMLIEFLQKNYSIDWVKKGLAGVTKAKIEKTDDNKTIRVFTEKNWLSLKLNDEKTKVNLTIDDGRTDEFVVKMENDKPYIYSKPNKKYISSNITVLTYLRENEELYPRVPFFLITVGYAMFLNLFIYNIDMPFLGQIGFYSIYFGFLIIYIKKSLERQIYYSLERANRILDKIDVNNKNSKDIKSLKRYISLTFKNINRELGRDIELKTCDGISESTNVEDTLIKYLPYYIRFSDKEQLYSAKTHLKTMLNSVDVDDKIKWKEFTDAAMSLTIEITTYLRENNFNLTYRKLPMQLSWIDRNKDAIIQSIGLIIPIIIVFLEKGKGS